VKEESDDSDLERDEEDDTDWLRQSMRESMANWSKEVAKMTQEIHHLDNKIILNQKGNQNKKIKQKSKKKIVFNEEFEIEV